jgi:hypothetical protein
MGYYDDLFDDDDATIETVTDDHVYADNGLQEETEDVLYELGSTGRIEHDSATSYDDDDESEKEDEDDGWARIGNAESVQVPDDLTGSAVISARADLQRARFNGHSAYNSYMRDLWLKAIQMHPYRFDALLYRATTHQQNADDDGHEEDPIITLDPNQDLLDYADPEVVCVVDTPDESEQFLSLVDGSDNTGIPETALILRVGAKNIPVGSILEWNESMVSGTVRRWWYIQKIYNYGTANIGSLFFCVPCRTFEERFDS